MNFDSLEGFSTLGPNMRLDPQNLDAEEVLRKAYTPGTGIVQAGETTAAALRAQVLDPLLVAALYQTQDARFLQLLYSLTPLRADSVAYEYTNMEKYGSDTEAFLQDVGAAAASYSVIADQINTADDVYQRYVKNARFMGTRRIVSLSAALSRAIINPLAAAMVGATNEIIGKANSALYYGNPAVNALHWEGIDFQIMNAYFNGKMTASSVAWATEMLASAFTAEPAIILDAKGRNLAESASMIQNQQIAEPLIQEAAARISENFGYPQVVLLNPRVMQAIASSLAAKERIIPSTQTGIAGVFANMLVTSDGMPLQLVVDRLLQPGRSLIPHKPLAYDTDMTGIPSGPTANFGTVTCQIVNPGAATLRQWFFGSWNNLSGAAPTISTGSIGYDLQGLEDNDYLNYNNTGSTVYVYYKLYIVLGDGRIANSTTVSASKAGAFTKNLVLLTSTLTNLTNTPYTSTGAPDPLYYKNVRVRIYRSCPTTATQASPSYKFVGEAGVYQDGANYVWWFIDNGKAAPWDANGHTGSGAIGSLPLALKPVTDVFVLSLDKPPFWNVRFLQFLPLMQRALPPAPLADQFAYLLFGTPIVRVPRWCAVIKNVAWTYAR